MNYFLKSTAILFFFILCLLNFHSASAVCSCDYPNESTLISQQCYCSFQGSSKIEQMDLACCCPCEAPDSIGARYSSDKLFCECLPQNFDPNCTDCQYPQINMNCCSSIISSLSLTVTEKVPETSFKNSLLSHTFAQDLFSKSIVDAKVQLLLGSEILQTIYTSTLGTALIQANTTEALQIVITKSGYKKITANWNSESGKKFEAKFEAELGSTNDTVDQSNKVIKIEPQTVIELSTPSSFDTKNTSTLFGKLEGKILDSFINFFLTWLYGIAGAIATLMLMFSGFRIITAKNPNDIKKAKKSLQNSLIGLLLIFSAWILTSYLQQDLVFKWTLGK